MLPNDPRLLALRDLLPGQVLQGTRGARYHLRERIGEGGQGWVFKASWDEPGGYLVIVKVLRPDSVNAESLTRFEREAQVLRMLGQATRPNPYIVRFFDHATSVLQPAGGPAVELRFTALEYVRGPTLEQVLAQCRGSGLSLERTRRIGRQMSLALEDVHAHKIVHRDLKPSNVLLASETGGEIAKVTDFGLVKLVDMGLGKTTALAGASLGYAPPEQFEQGNRRVSPRTDVFSYAAMVYEMLTGVKAFPYGEGENPLLIVTRLLNGPRPSLGSSRGTLPPELATRRDVVERLDALLVRATSAEPGDRHATVAELWAAIDPLLRAASERRSFSPSSMVAAPSVEPAPASSLPPTPAPAEGNGPTQETAARSAPHPEAEALLSNPASWKWRVCNPPVRAGAVRAATFDPGGAHAYAIGSTGVTRWDGSGWTRVVTNPEIDARAARGVALMAGGELLVFGTHGLASRMQPGGVIDAWDLPDKEVTFLGAHSDLQAGVVTLVGERPARSAVRGGQATTMGTIAQFARGKLTLLADAASAARLRGVTRLRNGAVVACGDWGAIVRLELGVPEHVGSICGGHLHAIATLADGGAVTVGAGGHALSLSPRLRAQLEAVQTTRDLRALCADPAGVAWAGSAQARLLRRTAGSWVRMSGELGLQSSVVALWATQRLIRAICDDGAVIEGVVP